jgi:hypothetical protein
VRASIWSGAKEHECEATDYFWHCCSPVLAKGGVSPSTPRAVACSTIPAGSSEGRSAAHSGRIQFWERLWACGHAFANRRPEAARSLMTFSRCNLRARTSASRSNSRPWGIDAILARATGRLSSSISTRTASATGGLCNAVAARTAPRAASVASGASGAACSTCPRAAAARSATTTAALRQRSGT